MNKISLALLLIVSVICVTRANAADEQMNLFLLDADDLNSWMLEDADRYVTILARPHHTPVV